MRAAGGSVDHHWVERYIIPGIADAAADRHLPLLPRPRPLRPRRASAQAIRRGLADEVSWLNWISESCSEGIVTIRVARLGDEAMYFRVYRPSAFGKRRRSHGIVSSADWALIEVAVVRSRFWLLDEQEAGGLRLGGARWYFAGRRGPDFHFISRRSPRDALWDLGRLLFDVAGLSEIRLY
jgi:hypothetical protein